MLEIEIEMEEEDGEGVREIYSIASLPVKIPPADRNPGLSVGTSWCLTI